MRYPLVLIAAMAPAVAALAQPQPARMLVDSVGLEMLTESLPATAQRIDYHAGRDILFIMHRNGDIGTFDLHSSTYEKVADGSALGIAEPSGFGISPQGDLFVDGNTRDGVWVTGFVKRSHLVEGSNVPGPWVTVAETVPYPLSKNFNHLWSSLVVGPEGEWIYVNSGSRSDHGEVEDYDGAHPGAREEPITSAILRIPADGQSIMLYNNVDSLAAGGYFFADGVRNHFDMAFGPSGHLFGVENSGDRDDAEELNWLQQGHHYGFPWRIGTHDTPMQFPDYDPSSDPLINPLSSAAQIGLFKNDPDYPPPPEGVEFTDPIPNAGPDAVEYRDPVSGAYLDGSVTGEPVGSFTPHKSPLGLVFDTAGVLAEPYNGDGFVLGWNNAGSALLGPFQDPGEDLLHLELDYDSLAAVPYRMHSTRIADSFAMPIDAVLIDTTMYVLEMRFTCNAPPSPCARLWRLDFPRKPVEVPPGLRADKPEIPEAIDIEVFPNPFSDRIEVNLKLDRPRQVSAELIDVMGRAVRSSGLQRLSAGSQTLHLRTDGLSAGTYLIQIASVDSKTARVVTLIR